ncbi:MAG: protease, partial [Candidatus Eremiobacteraeota bacterium]|nr:protease [Candidatus Eremiobacteraeota bacterium]
MNRTFFVAAAVAILALFAAGTAQAQTPYIFQNPTLSATRIAFEWGGDIWTVARSGGEARQLVTGYNLEGAPYFSPDGSMVAFTGNYNGNSDVYVVRTTGGEPRRLTFHPGADVAVGWTNDGQAVLFRSGRASYADENMLYTVPVRGGFPKALPLAMAESGSYSPDGTHLAYVPTGQWEPQWQHYRGGQTTPIWIADLANSSIVKVPRSNSNDRNPMWVGNSVYFLSDRNGPATLYEYNTQTHSVRELVRNSGWDVLSADAGPGGIVYAQMGSMHLYDLASGRANAVPV